MAFRQGRRGWRQQGGPRCAREGQRARALRHLRPGVLAYLAHRAACWRVRHTLLCILSRRAACLVSTRAIACPRILGQGFKQAATGARCATWWPPRSAYTSLATIPAQIVSPRCATFYHSESNDNVHSCRAREKSERQQGRVDKNNINSACIHVNTSTCSHTHDGQIYKYFASGCRTAAHRIAALKPRGFICTEWAWGFRASSWPAGAARLEASQRRLSASV